MTDVFGIELPDIPDGTVVDVLVIAKVLGKDETQFPYALISRASDGLSTWEVVGMCNTVAARIVARMVAE